MGLFDSLKKKESIVLVALADFTKEPNQPGVGVSVSRVVGGPGLIKKDGSVDLNNMMGILVQTRKEVPEAAGATSFGIWCGELGKSDDDPYAIFYDLLKAKDIDFAKMNMGFSHIDLRKFPGSDKSGLSFDIRYIKQAKIIEYKWVK